MIAFLNSNNWPAPHAKGGERRKVTGDNGAAGPKGTFHSVKLASRLLAVWFNTFLRSHGKAFSKTFRRE